MSLLEPDTGRGHCERLDFFLSPRAGMMAWCIKYLLEDLGLNPPNPRKARCAVLQWRSGKRKWKTPQKPMGQLT